MYAYFLVLVPDFHFVVVLNHSCICHDTLDLINRGFELFVVVHAVVLLYIVASLSKHSITDMNHYFSVHPVTHPSQWHSLAHWGLCQAFHNCWLCRVGWSTLSPLCLLMECHRVLFYPEVCCHNRFLEALRYVDIIAAITGHCFVVAWPCSVDVEPVELIKNL